MSLKNAFVIVNIVTHLFMIAEHPLALTEYKRRPHEAAAFTHTHAHAR